MKNLTVYLGPPGTGKTHTLNEQVRRRKLNPRTLYYVAFTRKAAQEAAARVGVKTDAINYSTLHALCFRLLNCARGDMMQGEDYDRLGKLINVSFSRYYDSEEALEGSAEGDRLRAVVDLARARVEEPEAVRLAEGVDVAPRKLEQYAATLARYKDDTGKLDFSDLLSIAIEKADPLECELAVIDEAQDLSLLQWRAARHLFSRAREVLVAGDDDQAIFKWAGADVEEFLGLRGKREVLAQSYRCPRAVFRVAQKITRDIRHRYAKDWRATRETGEVHTVADPEAVDLDRPGSYLLLVRNGMHLRVWREELRRRGLPYILRQQPGAKAEHLRAIRAWEAVRVGKPIRAGDEELLQRYRTGTGPWWEALGGLPAADRDYYREVRARGHALDGVEAERYRINTIHGVKGGEADHVVLLTDRAPRTDAQGNTDEEHRVWYVAVTRARKTLQVVQPQGIRAYPLVEKCS